MIVLGAKAVIEGPKGWKTLALEDFFDNTGKALFQKDEVLIEVRIPEPPAEAGLIYLRNPGTPMVRVAVLLKLDAKHVNTEAFKIVVAGIAPKPQEAIEAEGIMNGKAIDNDLIEEAARLMVYEAAELIDEGNVSSKQSAMAKCLATDVGMKVADQAIEILGAEGVTAEHPIEMFERDAKLLQVVEGTNQVQRLIISRILLS